MLIIFHQTIKFKNVAQDFMSKLYLQKYPGDILEEKLTMRALEYRKIHMQRKLVQS